MLRSLGISGLARLALQVAPKPNPIAPDPNSIRPIATGDTLFIEDMLLCKHSKRIPCHLIRPLQRCLRSRLS